MTMNPEQTSLLNSVQQTLRGLVVAFGALNPDAAPEVAALLRDAANGAVNDKTAAGMLNDLAKALETVTKNRPR